MMSDEACRGLIENFHDDINDPCDVVIEGGFTHPSHQKRIKKMQKVLEAKKRYTDGFCWNPLYKQVGGPKWYRCNNQESSGLEE